MTPSDKSMGIVDPQVEKVRCVLCEYAKERPSP